MITRAGFLVLIAVLACKSDKAAPTAGSASGATPPPRPRDAAAARPLGRRRAAPGDVRSGDHARRRRPDERRHRPDEAERPVPGHEARRPARRGRGPLARHVRASAGHVARVRHHRRQLPLASPRVPGRRVEQLVRDEGQHPGRLVGRRTCSRRTTRSRASASRTRRTPSTSSTRCSASRSGYRTSRSISTTRRCPGATARSCSRRSRR